MLYLLDANILIQAHNTYYSIDRVPEFWEWLAYNARNDKIKMAFEILDEVKKGREDQLYHWIRDTNNYNALLLNEQANIVDVQRVIREGYAPDLTQTEMGVVGRDPFLITYALGYPDRCVVTNESSGTSKIRQNRRIPDVCTTFGIQWCNAFTLNSDLNFRTSWE